MNLITDTSRSQSPTRYVVLSRDRSTLLADPGLGKPFNTTNRKYAEQVAKECRGYAVSLIDAARILDRDATGKNTKAIRDFLQSMQG